MSSARQDFWTGVRATTKHLKTQDDSPVSNDQDSSAGESAEALPTSQYQYIDLPNAETFIRILELLPGHGNNTIVCRLRGLSLEASVHQYEALSYVWTIPGEESTQTTIQIEDGSLEIGSSLHDSLRYLRYSDRSRFLWMDAICINQSKIEERSIQVPLMCEIYRNATRTVCFLGLEIETTPRMFAMLEELAEESKTMEDDTLDGMRTLPAFVNHLPVHPVKTKLFEKYEGDSTIVDLAQRPWWHRAWTVQEIMLSSDAIVMIGPHTITWNNLCFAIDHGLNTQIWGPVFLGFIMNPIVVPYISMRALMNRYRSRLNQEVSPAANLLNLLVHCRHRDSTEPRDKIYSALGLLRDTHPEALSPESPNSLDIQLGYSYDVVHVYRKMSQELILKTENLEILGICPKTELQLPSWVTDWSITDRIGSPLMQDSLDRPRTTHATKNTKANAQFSSDGKTLILQGYELTTIDSLASVLPVPSMRNIPGGFDEHSIEKLFHDMIPDFDSMAATSDAKLAILTAKLKIHFARIVFIFKVIIKAITLQYEWFVHDGREIMAVFITLFAWESFFAAHLPPTNPCSKSKDIYHQTLCLGTYTSSTSTSTKQIYTTWSSLLQPLRKTQWLWKRSPILGIVIYMYTTWNSYGEFWPLMASAQHRRMGWMGSGWLGLFPEGAERGDMVVLVRGGRVPLVVRKVEGRMVFVGEVFVQGIMDGEVWDEERCGVLEIS